MGKTQSKALAERHGRGTAWYVGIGLYAASCFILLPGIPVRDSASLGAGADPAVFYIAVIGFSGLRFQSV
jgi:hypothetical protein